MWKVLVLQQVNILMNLNVFISISPFHFHMKYEDDKLTRKSMEATVCWIFICFSIFTLNIILGMCIILRTACYHTSCTVMMYAKYLNDYSVTAIFGK